MVILKNAFLNPPILLPSISNFSSRDKKKDENGKIEMEVMPKKAL